MVLGPWSLVLGPWSLVHGPWSMVLGPWSMVLGPWSLVLGPWSMVLARCESLCHIFLNFFIFFATLECGVDWFYFILRSTISEKNLLRLLGVDVRSDTLGLRKNNLLVVCRLII